MPRRRASFSDTALTISYTDLPNGVTSAHLARVSTITPFLEELPDGIDTAIAYLRTSTSPIARTFLGIWDGIVPTRRAAIPFEAFALAAGVNPDQLFGVIMESLSHSSNVKAVIRSALKYPDVVSKTIDVALTDPGVQDRNTLHRHAQFVPQSINQKVLINQTSTHNESHTQNVSIDVSQLRNIDADLLRITSAFDESLGMAHAEPPRVIEAHAVDVTDVEALTDPDDVE